MFYFLHGKPFPLLYVWLHAPKSGFGAAELLETAQSGLISTLPPFHRASLEVSEEW